MSEAHYGLFQLLTELCSRGHGTIYLEQDLYDLCYKRISVKQSWVTDHPEIDHNGVKILPWKPQ